MTRTAIGAVIRLERTRLAMSQYAMAAALGICPSALSRIETGDRNVTVAELVTLARVLRLSPGEIIERAQALK